MTETNPLSRFKSQESAIRAPGSCLTCRSATGPFIDTGVFVQWHGQVYLCVNCLREMADNLGLIRIEHITIVEPDIEEVKNAVRQFRDSAISVHRHLDATFSRLSPLLEAVGTEAKSGDDQPVNESIETSANASSEQGAAGISSDSSDGLLELDGFKEP